MHLLILPLFFLLSTCIGKQSHHLGQAVVPTITSLQIPIPENSSEILTFKVDIELIGPKYQTWWMMVEVTNLETRRILHSKYIKIQNFSFSAIFPNTDVDRPERILLFQGMKYSLRAAIALNPTNNVPNYGYPFNLTCCHDWIRPENQTTLYLSGEVTEPVKSLYQKIHIANNTVLRASVESYWEITLEESVTFIADFFNKSISTTIKTQKPIFLQNTSLHIQWLSPDPNHQKRKDSLTLVSGPINRVSIFGWISSSSTWCQPVGLSQSFEARKNSSDSINLNVDFETTCDEECPAIYDHIGTLFIIIGGAYGPILLICFYKWGKRNDLGLVTFSNTVLKIAMVLAMTEAFLLCSLLTTLYFLRLGNGYCEIDFSKYKQNEFFKELAMWISPAIWGGLAWVFSALLLSRRKCIGFPIQEIDEDEDERIQDLTEFDDPVARAFNYIKDLSVCLFFFWLFQAIPPIPTHYLGDGLPIPSQRDDGPFWSMWLSVYFPMALSFVGFIIFLSVLTWEQNKVLLRNFIQEDEKGEATELFRRV